MRHPRYRFQAQDSYGSSSSSSSSDDDNDDSQEYVSIASSFEYTPQVVKNKEWDAFHQVKAQRYPLDLTFLLLHRRRMRTPRPPRRPPTSFAAGRSGSRCSPP